MNAPAIWPDRVNSILINLPKREELLLRTVCALPNASRMGLAWSICFSRVPKVFDEPSDATAARYWMTFFVFSVFPAPDSPL